MIIPKGHRVVVRFMKIEERDEAFKKAKAAGLVLAEHEDTKRREAGVDRGEVISVGPDAFKAFYLNSNGTLDGFTPWCQPGDFIAFAKYAGMHIKDGDSDYIVINDEDVVAVLKD